MYRYKIVLFLVMFCLNINIAHAIFGQEDVPLEEYYQLGQHQKGVAAVATSKGFGTANLIDVGIESLKGRLMVTCAHVIDGTDAKTCMVRFMDELNKSYSVPVQELYFPSNYKNEKVGQDIGFILLETAMDIQRFLPLKLNLSINNERVKGKEVNAFGCTSIFGRCDTSTVIEEGMSSSLRRGMRTVISYASNNDSYMNSVFHSQHGEIRISRNAETGLSPQAQIEKQQIEQEIAQLKPKFEEAKRSGDVETLQKIKERGWELSVRRDSELSEVETRERLSQTIVCKDDFEDKLNQLKDTDDLDKQKILQEWSRVQNDKEPVYHYTVTLGKYYVTLYKPLPRLSGLVYHGDSGGAWVLDDKIIGLSKGMIEPHLNIFQEIKQAPSYPFNASEYFKNCEQILENNKSKSTLFTEKSCNNMAVTSIWSCRDWINSTLLEISRSLKGAISIKRDAERGLSPQAQIEKQQIEQEIAQLKPKFEEAKRLEDVENLQKIKERGLELSLQRDFGFSEIETRKGLFENTLCEEGFEDKLNQLKDTDDLNKKILLQEWKVFRNAQEKNRFFSLGNYSIELYSYYRP